MPKHPGGRPLKFKSVKELQVKIDEYFKSCWGQKIGAFGPIWDGKGKDRKPVMTQIKPYTVGGLAVYLETSRDVLMTYEDSTEKESISPELRKQFSDAIKAAKAKIYAFTEESLFEGHATGPIFSLKNNYGWKDKTEVEHSGAMTIGQVLNDLENGRKTPQKGLANKDAVQDQK